MPKTQNIELFDLTAHQNETFLIGGYRVKKGQLDWILGKKPSRGQFLYNTRFTVTGKSCRNGAMTTGEKPDFIVLYDYANTEHVRLFRCLSYSIKTPSEMKELRYPNSSLKHSYIVYELGTEYDAKDINIPALIAYARDKYPAYSKKTNVAPFTIKGQDILLANRQELPLLEGRDNIRIIDLFAGLGGFHLAFKKLGAEMGFNVQCRYVSELREDLRHLYEINHGVRFQDINPDITRLTTDEIIEREVPEHDILCGGFPCQPFSKAGKQQGFNDEEGRGELFYYIADIIRVRRPKYIFLENVANLETHDEGNTWQTIFHVLSDELNYEVRWKILSPHEYGLPQHRKRIYIVGKDRLQGDFNTFDFPLKPKEATCDINNIIEKKAIDFQPFDGAYFEYFAKWQEFLRLCKEHNAELPHAPIWGMEFGADYPYEELAPQHLTAEQLRGHRGRMGIRIEGDTLAECLSCLPNYAKKSKTRVFPDWKIKFIKENRDFYERNREWIDPWKEEMINWEDSFIKFEWNCPEDVDVLTMMDKIIQFRPSGLRVKLPNYSPALTYMSSQVPIYPWVKYTLPNGQRGRGRYMTVKEGANLQGMGDLSFDGLTESRIYEALGNAVDVDLVKIIAKRIIEDE